MRVLTRLVLIALLFLAPVVSARDVEGISIPETATLPTVDAPLVLNGAGLRQRFFVKVYVGALYLPAKESSAEAIIAATGAKAVRLHFLYEEVEAKKLHDAWTDGFKANHSEAELQPLASQIAQFNAMFRSVRRGETIRLDLLPNGETRVAINDEPRGVVAGADFQRALLKIWIGEKPVEKDLKRAMLGAN